MEEKLTLEETFEKLTAVITSLESGELSLADSIAAYEQGMTYIKACNAAIDEAEKKVMMIRENGELDEFFGSEEE